MGNGLNLFWACVWAAMLVICIIGLFWIGILFAGALMSAVMVGVFVHDYIKIARMK